MYLLLECISTRSAQSRSEILIVSVSQTCTHWNLWLSIVCCYMCVSMAVVIRLQRLNVTAGTEDIRKFFTGLKIPDGGVHIIGGDQEEAFIIFATDEDARRAMSRSGHCINGTPVTLLLSSKSEMQTMLERSTKIVELEQRNRFEENERPTRRSLGSEVGRLGHTSSPNHQTASKCDDGLLVFLKGLPFSVTEKEIHDFFSGLLIDEIVLVKNKKGSNNGTGFVKFATREDAIEGLKRDREYIGSRYIELSMTTAYDWYRNTGRPPMADNRNENFVRERSPIRNQRIQQDHHAKSQSPMAQMLITPGNEYCVLVDNLSYAVGKEDMKKLFDFAKLEDDQILHLMDSEGRRTRSAFVLFKNQRDYCEALANEKRQFFHRYIFTRPISRENMMTLLESHCMDVQPPGNSQEFSERPSSYPSDHYDSEKLCLFVRNLPLDVRKVEIMDFFLGFNITEDKVFLLFDHNGAGVGKALILFRSEAEATRALSLNGQRFLGSEVILKCITRSQMKQLGVEPPMVQEPLSREERYSGRSRASSYHSDSDRTEFPDYRMSRDGNIPVTDELTQFQGDYDYETRSGTRGPHGRGNGVRGDVRPSSQPFDGPTCVRLVNLPFQIRTEEIYDFCHGYQIIPGSVSLQFDQSGKPTGTATVVFQSRSEAMTAVEELSGRPIGPRKIKLLFV
ncbi:RNA-binding protein 12B-B-like isoform X2 [Solea senegalensis]|uniref:RNA-binding protein 12B-B-like isoform X2 n=1 Tax=Solea senegalensis TaxID=28829 RepID=A0AAV6PSU5_SOLSE|nr:RNA-binding protein 12B-B-like isoform X2 [Solea senegalensis]